MQNVYRFMIDAYTCYVLVAEVHPIYYWLHWTSCNCMHVQLPAKYIPNKDLIHTARTI
jgi:hypothetical protein